MNERYPADPSVLGCLGSIVGFLLYACVVLAIIVATAGLLAELLHG